MEVEPTTNIKNSDISSQLASLKVGDLSEPTRYAMSQEVEQRIMQLEHWQAARIQPSMPDTVLPLQNMAVIEQRFHALERRLQA